MTRTVTPIMNKAQSLSAACTLLAMSTFSALGGTANEPMLECHLKAPASVESDKPIPLQFKLINRGEQPLSVLKWNTPLEGWFNNSFDIEVNGQKAQYIGAMVKRFRPGDEDYVEIAPGKSTEGEVDLTQGYDMKTPGMYGVNFKGYMQDVQVLKSGQSRNPQPQFHKIHCNSVTIHVR